MRSEEKKAAQSIFKVLCAAFFSITNRHSPYSLLLTPYSSLKFTVAHYVPYISFPRFVSAVRRAEWREFLEGYGKGLER